MRPLKLTMQAFGPYLEKQFLDFGTSSQEAALLIQGPGGSGKTFLIEAIFFALFGHLRLESDHSLKNLRNSEAGPELPTEVILNFQSGEKHYRVERRLEIKANNYKASCCAWQATLESLDNKEYIAIGCCEVNSIIEIVIGLERSDYISLVLPSLGHKNTMISLEKGVSKSFLQRIFQADYLENIWPEILRQSNYLLQHIIGDKLSIKIPEAGSAEFKEDYFAIIIKDSSGSINNPPQRLTAGTRAIILASLHLSILKVLRQHCGFRHEFCLFLERFLELLDQASLEKFTSVIQREKLKGIHLFITSSILQHQQFFAQVEEAKVDDTSRELVRIAKLCREGLAKKYEMIDHTRQKRLDYELVYAISKFKGEALAEANKAYQDKTGIEIQLPVYLRDTLSTINTLLELVTYLHKNEIPFNAGSGRSSSSLVLYALGITELDPLALNLSADHFFYPLHRGSPLPVWFNLPDQYQEKVFDYAVDKYDRETAELLFPGIDCLAMWYFTEAQNRIHQITQAVQKSQGKKLELAKIPLDDPEAFTLLAEGDTNGIYALSGIIDIATPFDRKLKDHYQAQLIENDEISKALKDYKPINFEELMLIVSLFNLGPRVNERIDLISRIFEHKRNGTAVRHKLPVLQDNLENTRGLLVYREQLLDIVMAISRFNMTEAERFYKLMLSGYIGDKRKEEFQAKRRIFIKRGLVNGYTEAQLKMVLEILCNGANLLTIKANAANHTLIAYRMAYFKAHYREEYFNSS